MHCICHLNVAKYSLGFEPEHKITAEEGFTSNPFKHVSVSMNTDQMLHRLVFYVTAFHCITIQDLGSN